MKFRIAQSAVPRARGAVELSSKAFEGRSVLAGLRQSGAFKVLFPRSQGTLQAILINTAGGVTGGDRFALEAGGGRLGERPGGHRGYRLTFF